MKLQVVDKEGKKVKEFDLPKNVLPGEVNLKVISQYVYSYLSNQRQSTADTKDRSEVRGGGKKPWRQKGTGRARFGSSRVPIWRGGGVAFGPTADRNFKKKMTKKFKRAALKNVLAKIIADEKLKIIDSLDSKVNDKFAKNGIELMQNLGVSGSVIFVSKEKNEALIKSFRNIKKTSVSNTTEVSAYDLFSSANVVVEEEALKILLEKLSK
ncbi:MAG: 50S ribosomal protein L4 [Candidatus Dojkabacteria bacterium]